MKSKYHDDIEPYISVIDEMAKGEAYESAITVKALKKKRGAINRKIKRNADLFDGLWRITHNSTRTVYDCVDDIDDFVSSHYREFGYDSPRKMFNSLSQARKREVNNVEGIYKRKPKWTFECSTERG